MQVPSLGGEDSLEEGMATHSSILAWRIPADRGAWQVTIHGVAGLDLTEATARTQAIAGDMGLVPGLGGSHVPWSSY